MRNEANKSLTATLRCAPKYCLRRSPIYVPVLPLLPISLNSTFTVADMEIVDGTSNSSVAMDLLNIMPAIGDAEDHPPNPSDAAIESNGDLDTAAAAPTWRPRGSANLSAWLFAD